MNHRELAATILTAVFVLAACGGAPEPESAGASRSESSELTSMMSECSIGATDGKSSDLTDCNFTVTRDQTLPGKPWTITPITNAAATTGLTDAQKALGQAFGQAAEKACPEGQTAQFAMPSMTCAKGVGTKMGTCNVTCSYPKVACTCKAD